jgi:hypothetical protein
MVEEVLGSGFRVRDAAFVVEAIVYSGFTFRIPLRQFAQFLNPES